LVSVFVDEAISVVGGNWQIFKKMIISSKAKLHLNTPVTEIRETERNRKSFWEVSSSKGNFTFDAVILASPYVLPFDQLSDLSIFQIFQ